MPGKRPTDSDPRWIWKLAPAPGELRVVHAFVKTAEGREELSSPGALSDWLALWELLPTAIELGAEDLDRALDVRRALHAMIDANSGAALDAKAPERLDRALAHIPFRLRVATGAVMRYQLDATGFDAALARLLVTVKVHREGAWRRLKRCHGEGCGLIFHDSSPNICGKWCSTRCGNKLSARGYRKRFKRRHGGTPGSRGRRFS